MKDFSNNLVSLFNKYLKEIIDLDQYEDFNKLNERQKVEYEAKIKDLDNRIASSLEKYPELGEIVTNAHNNLGMLCAMYELEKSVLVALDNRKAAKQVNDLGYNMGYLAAMYGLEKAKDKAIKLEKDPMAAKQIAKVYLINEFLTNGSHSSYRSL